MEYRPLRGVTAATSPGLPFLFCVQFQVLKSLPKRLGSVIHPPLLKGQVQTSMPCYVSELSSVPNQRQLDLLLLLIDLIFSYQRAGRGWGDSVDQKPTHQ